MSKGGRLCRDAQHWHRGQIVSLSLHPYHITGLRCIMSARFSWSTATKFKRPIASGAPAAKMSIGQSSCQPVHLQPPLTEGCHDATMIKNMAKKDNQSAAAAVIVLSLCFGCSLSPAGHAAGRVAPGRGPQPGVAEGSAAGPKRRKGAAAAARRPQGA